jgi:hypothetical protein
LQTAYQAGASGATAVIAPHNQAPTGAAQTGGGQPLFTRVPYQELVAPEAVVLARAPTVEMEMSDPRMPDDRWPEEKAGYTRTAEDRAAYGRTARSSNAMWGWILGAVALVVVLFLIFGLGGEGTRTADTPGDRPAATTGAAPPASTGAAPPARTTPPAGSPAPAR